MTGEKIAGGIRQSFDELCQSRRICLYDTMVNLTHREFSALLDAYTVAVATEIAVILSEKPEKSGRVKDADPSV